MELIESLLAISDEDVKNVRKHFAKTEEEINIDVNIIVAWMKQQAHFPEDYDKGRIERVLLRNKFRIEKTKNKLEQYYTLKGLHTTFFSNVDPVCEAMQNLKKSAIYVPLPKVTPSFERIFVIKFTENSDVYCFEHLLIYMLVVLDIELSYDYTAGTRIIVDLEFFNMEHLKQLNVNTISIVEKLHEEAFSGRIMSVDIINAPSVLNVILNILKLAIKPKLFNKIRTHKNYESLLKVYAIECLPIEYGGNSLSVHKIHDDMGKMLLSKREFILEQSKKVSNEKLRIGPVRKNDLYGIEGTFKSINID